MEVTIDTYPDRIKVKIPFDDSIPVLAGGGERVVDEEDNAWAVWEFSADADPEASAREAALLFKQSIPAGLTDTTTITVKV